MPGSVFANRLGDLVDLTTSERSALARLEERERTVRRDATLVRENDRLTELYILQSGMMMSYVVLDDGSRQILCFLFPGDLLGVSALLYAKSPETIVALSDCVVAPFDRALVTALVVDHPRLAAAMMVLNQMERIALTDRLAALGRTSAKARVAGLLLEIRDRLRSRDGGRSDSFTPGLTQEEIGDATGLTAVHVNRMLRQLEEERMIAREGGRVTVLDEASLARAANYTDRFHALDLGWLPPGR